MPNPWDPEKTVSHELASSLLESAFPELAPVWVEVLGAGWDNTAFLVNGSLVFRFPRRQIAVPLLATEVRTLPELGPRLPLPIPHPRWIGSPVEQYPWPFAGYRKIPGRSAFAACLSDDARLRLARPLGEFLAVLHSTPLADTRKWGVGPDEFGKLDVRRRSVKITRSLAELVGRGVLDDSRPWLDVVDEALRVPAMTKTTLVHGDLDAEHLLVDSNELSGVIDWGDVHCGQPAEDLSIAWTFFPPAGREALFAGYGTVDDATLSLARFCALKFAVEEDAYGRACGKALCIAEAHRTLLALV
jgi:aminoglycoside phosphotransferase (APT) family kinase protein